MNESNSLFQNVVSQILEREGALVEPLEPDGIELVAPPRVQEVLNIPEMARLGFAAELPAGAQPVRIESDWIGRLGKLFGERGKRVCRRFSGRMPQLGSPERILEHGISLQNAIYRLTGISSAWTRYLFLTFRYAALSEEKREGLVSLGVNLSTRSAVDGWFEAFLSAPGSEENVLGSDGDVPAQAEDLPPLWGAEQLAQFSARALPPRIHHHLSPFIQGLKRRMDRDLARIFDYYDGLRRESIKRLSRASADAAREQLRQDAIAQEYQAKIADLRQKYSMKVEMQWAQTLEIISPVQRFELLIKRRKGERRIQLDWNPILRKLEPLPCEHGYACEPVRVVCDEALHLVSPAGHAACPGCQREYCRVCHMRKCPKCG